MKKNIDDELIVKPKPLRDFVRERTVYIPVDSPSRFIQKAIRKSLTKEKVTAFGNLYLLKNKTILYQCVGAPLAVLTLERLIASRAKEIIILGFCGSLNPKAKIKTAVSITKALSEEGTSKHYFPRKRIFYPSASLKKKVENKLRDLGHPFLHGAIVSTDAPYRETQSWLTLKQEKGIDFVDMETSAVFALAEYHNIHAAALMLVSDELTLSKWKTGFHNDKFAQIIENYFFSFIED